MHSANEEKHSIYDHFQVDLLGVRPTASPFSKLTQAYVAKQVKGNAELGFEESCLPTAGTSLHCDGSDPCSVQVKYLIVMGVISIVMGVIPAAFR